MKKNVACGVVTFNPTKDILPKIEEYSHLFDYVYIYDNTIKGLSSVLTNKISRYKNVLLYTNGNNDGLAKAYNYFLIRTKNKYDFLCTLDQDSKFSKMDIQSMFNLLNVNKLNDVAVVGPVVIYNQVSTSKKISNEKELKNRQYLISSGSFINLKIIRQNPNIKFDENYFIDRVDTDFCTDCLRNGYRICEYEHSVLFQNLGEKITKKGSQHSYIRHYYMFRNRIYFNYKYYGKLKATILTCLQSLKQCMRIVFLEKQKKIKLKQFILAYHDYVTGDMGKGRY